MDRKIRLAALTAAHVMVANLHRTMIALLYFWLRYNGKKRMSYSYKEKMPQQVQYMERLLSDENSACLDELRVTKTVFFKLCRLLEEKGGLKPGKYVNVPEMVAMFLGILGHDKKTREQKHSFRRSTWTVSKHFNNVLKAILSLRTELYVKAEPINIHDPTSKFRFFENCLGALDGSYFNVRVKADLRPRFRNRHKDISTNVLGVCNEDLNFIYVLSGWEGSAADSRVLRSALDRRNPFSVRRGCYYLCDNGYTNCEGFLAPYKSTRYHLKDWGTGPLAPQNAKEYFNMRHSSARNVIERAWGLMKMRWGILRTASFYPIKIQMRIIVACALLHNFIRREMAVDPWEAEVEENYHNVDTTDAEDADEEDGDIGNIRPSAEWNAWRDQLANNMYNAWRGSRRNV